MQSVEPNQARPVPAPRTTISPGAPSKPQRGIRQHLVRVGNALWHHLFPCASKGNRPSTVSTEFEYRPSQDVQLSQNTGTAHSSRSSGRSFAVAPAASESGSLRRLSFSSFIDAIKAITVPGESGEAQMDTAHGHTEPAKTRGDVTSPRSSSVSSWSSFTAITPATTASSSTRRSSDVTIEGFLDVQDVTWADVRSAGRTSDRNYRDHLNFRSFPEWSRKRATV